MPQIQEPKVSSSRRNIRGRGRANTSKISPPNHTSNQETPIILDDHHDESTISTTINKNDNPSTYICKACGEKLAENSWHCCKSCKSPLHAPIVCSKRDSIIQDDDILFCSVKCSRKTN
jgi:hypothetical protein